MTVEITFLGSPKHRCKDGKIYDVIDYPFRVSKGESNCTVVVGIPGQCHDPAEALGLKKLSSSELIKAATDWLHFHLVERGDRDPFSRPETDRVIDLSLDIVEHWADHRSFPPWF